MVWDSALEVPGAPASWSRSSATWYSVTAVPSTVPVPVCAAAPIAGWTRSRYPVGLAMPIMATAPSLLPKVPSVRPAKPGRSVPDPVESLPWGARSVSRVPSSQTWVPSRRTVTSRPPPTSADATMPRGLVSMTPLPCTTGLGWATGPLHTFWVRHVNPGGRAAVV